MAADSESFKKVFSLNNGVKMPGIGFGTYRIRGDDAILNVVDHALDAGYRMFDTAAVYGNEQSLKKAFNFLLPKYGLQRKDIFITTKLAPSDHGGSEKTENAVLKSLSNLGLDYIDLYLIHFPGTSGISVSDKRNADLRDKTWAKLAQIYKSGKVKAVGVSNYTVRHLTELLQNDHGVKPTVNQVEWHPYFFQPELMNYCQHNGIVLQAYCSLGGTSSHNVALLQDPVVTKIAAKLKISCPQLLLAWALQQNVAIIPKSTNREHMKSNANLNFVIHKEDLEELNSLGKNNVKYAWDPSGVV